MSDDQVTLTINGQTINAPKGSMLIEAADAAGIHIARFCYHKHLSVAANCRMCLVEAEKFNKPLPACATPVADGMTIWTDSQLAKQAQQAMMEFLLINHPLDCPICDQGGECDLQDQAMSHGNSAGSYQEIKRVVVDKDIGPLIETAMTRCIQCTRCVRFGEEIAGMREMGGIGRGDRLEIGTFIQHSLKSELSGNVIDLCPVGALTAKPSRYQARAWEMQAQDSIAPHDSVGSNIAVHTFDGEIVRVVPRDHEAINECWLSDRDRFSYQGLYAQDRLKQPMLKKAGEWQTVSWQEALEATSDLLRNMEPKRSAGLASASSTLEELFLFQALLRSQRVQHLDHRLNQADFRNQNHAPRVAWLGMSLPALQTMERFILIGSNVRQEQPLINHRIRQAIRLSGAKALAVNPYAVAFNYELDQHVIAPKAWCDTLAATLKLLAEKYNRNLSTDEAALCEQAETTDAAQSLVDALHDFRGQQCVLLLGNIASLHPEYARIQALSYALANLLNTRVGYLPERANSVGAAIAGMVPHHGALGATLDDVSDTYSLPQLLQSQLQTLMLLNVEPEDCHSPALLQQAMQQAEQVVAVTAYTHEALLQHADVLLPAAVWAETSGTYINADLQWQSFKGVTRPPGEARPAWKILRVLGNALQVREFDYMSTQEIVAELRLLALESDSLGEMHFELGADLGNDYLWSGLQRIGDVDPYRMDAIVRRASALQQQRDDAVVSINPEQAAIMGIEDGDMLRLCQGEAVVQLPVYLDAAIPEDCVRVASGGSMAANLGAAIGSIHVEKA